MANICKILGIILKVLVGGGLFVLLFLHTLKPQEVIFVDFNNDGFYERIERSNGVVKVFNGEELIFRTDPQWDVKKVMVGDFTNSGNNELALYLWKKGNYGKSLPFWLDKNDNSYKQHLFLYKWDDGIKSLWHSSNLPYINIKTRLGDFDGDGKNEIMVWERPYEWDNYGNGAKSVAIWQWDEWGFKKISRMKL
ncbi:hypothetical protein J7J83_03705 [bacterium]|nr:hypothetical protein [bacterium]